MPRRNLTRHVVQGENPTNVRRTSVAHRIIVPSFQTPGHSFLTATLVLFMRTVPYIPVPSEQLFSTSTGAALLRCVSMHASLGRGNRRSTLQTRQALSAAKQRRAPFTCAIFDGAACVCYVWCVCPSCHIAWGGVSKDGCTMTCPASPRFATREGTSG